MEHHPPGPSQPLDDAARAVLAAWVEQHWDGVYGLLYRLAGQAHEAEDLTQETFLRALQARDSFAAGTNLRAWLMRIATNAFFDRQRRQATAGLRPLPDEAALPAATTDYAGALHLQGLGAALETALRAVPETARAVFLLRTREDLSFRDIASVLHTTEQSARWHMHQARQRLMQLLKDWQ